MKVNEENHDHLNSFNKDGTITSDINHKYQMVKQHVLLLVKML